MLHDDRAEHLFIRVYPDYGAEWPVWGRWGAGCEGLLGVAHLPGLPPELVDDLRAWQQRWEADNSEPWVDRPDPHAEERQAELDRLAQRLAAELCAIAEVQTRTWTSTG